MPLLKDGPRFTETGQYFFRRFFRDAWFPQSTPPFAAADVDCEGAGAIFPYAYGTANGYSDAELIELVGGELDGGAEAGGRRRHPRSDGVTPPLVAEITFRQISGVPVTLGGGGSRARRCAVS